jgi:hypothetical protein
MKTLTAIADGFYFLNKHKNANSVIYASGTMGTATAKLVYQNVDKETYSDYLNGAITSGDQIQLPHGLGMTVYVEVSGANSSTNIEFKCAGID